MARFATDRPVRWGSLRTRVALGFTIPIVLMILSAVLRWVAAQEAANTTALVLRTEQALVEANELTTIFGDAQTGDLSAEESSVAFARQVARLEAVVADNAPQIERLRTILTEFQRWQRARGHDPAETKAHAAEVRGAIRVFVSTERSLLDVRRKARESAQTWLGKSIIVLPLIAVLLALLSALVLSAQIIERVRVLAGAAHALSSGRLDQRAEVKGSDELTALALSFNMMADRLVQRSLNVTLLNELGEGMQACITLEEAHGVAARLMHKALPGSTGAVALFNPSRNLVVRALTWGEAPPVGVSLAPEDCLALRRGRQQYVRGRADLRCKHLPERAGPEAEWPSLCIPLVAHGEAVGVFMIQCEGLVVEGEIGDFLHAVGEQLGLAYANLELRDRLRSQSIRDALTGLFNRRYLEETFARELARGTREGKSTGLLLFDVDHFKRFNDTFGHDAGDAVLREVGAIVRASSREADVPCRYGGEEFAILLPGVDGDALVRRAERLREAIKDRALNHHGRALGAITISIGVASAPRHDTTVEGLVRAADTALYEAKGAGRDRVVVARDQTPARTLVSLPPKATA